MASSTTTTNTSNIIESVVKEVGDIMSTRLSRVCADYALYKESHDAIMAIPAVQRAIRDGPRFKQEPQEAEADASRQEITHIQSQLTHCFEVIETLQSELQMVKLENDALRLQLQREPQTETSIESSPSENITLIIEEAESSTRLDLACCDKEETAQEEEEEEEVQDKNEEEDQATEEEEEEEDQDTVYEEEEQEDVEEDDEQEDVEEDEEQEDVEEDEEQEEAEEEQEEEEEQVQEEEEVEVVEVEIKGKMYFTTNETSGIIYECLADGDIGDEIGKFVKGKPVFNTKNK
jgi:hypothetical protein